MKRLHNPTSTPSACRSIPASVIRETNPPSPPHRFAQGLFSSARAWLAILALAALAVPNRAAANPFAATTLSPSSQTVSVGTPCTVDLVFAIGTDQYGTTYGIDATIDFDPTKVQVVSVTTGSASPFTNLMPGKNSVDNTIGSLEYAATGTPVANVTYTVATIVFMPIAAGTSALHLHSVNQYFTGYGPYGVDGQAVSGSITVTGPPLPTQTLTILGGVGNPGDIAANVEYYNPATGLWQAAYLVGQHPWGEVADTTSWINYKPSILSDPGAGPTINQTLWYLYRVRFTVPSDAVNPKMTFSVKADNFAQVAINGVTTGGTQMLINNVLMNNVIDGQADQLNADAVLSQNVHTGENTITINVGDYGGLNGFNFRIDLSMEASQPLEIVPVAPADTIPPVITAPANITVEATGPNGAVVTFTATAQDNVDGAVNVTANPASGSTFPLGTTHVGLAASDAAHNTATASFDVTVRDTTPPVISAPATATAEATSSAGATVIFVATANDVVSGNVSVTANPPSGSTFAIGFSSVSLSATDAAGNTATKNIFIAVRDTIAPVIASLTASSTSLWPPNHKMVPITLTAVTSDAVGVASLKIIGATSNEPDNGLGDGDTANDIEITGALTLNLRAERSGAGNGRVYTITVEAKDAAGNATTKTVTVSVPNSQVGN
jgi:HYR domain/Cohesin domain